MSTTTVSNSRRVWQWVAPLAALALLNASLTFRNVWPTPGVALTGDVSIELAIVVLGLAMVAGRAGAVPRWMTTALAPVWLLLVISRYADVTAPAIYGREVNLYWDSRHLGAVVSMTATVLAPWLVVAVIAAVAALAYIAHHVLRWAIASIAGAMRYRAARRTLTAAAVGLVLLFVWQQMVTGAPAAPRFATPVTESYARQVRLFVAATPAEIPAARRLDSSLRNVAGADVFLIFVESYGAVTYDNAAFRDALASGRADLADAIASTGRQVVSAFVTSPTFGGSSWLAHVSLLTGVEARNEDTNVRLMSQARDTLVTTFAAGGYRTIAAMPGNSHPWPEGAFYRYDHIYDRAALDYRGPVFGWWPVPDQFTLARIDELEIAAPRRQPVFLVMPTISTHAPFGPTAPYQPAWERMLNSAPYDAPDVAHALAQKPDLLNMGPSYVNAVSYTLASLGGYLRRRADRDLVMIVIGDHQPAAAVSGEGASWDVPIHVIASRPTLLERLRRHGFDSGLMPERAPLGPMHTLLPVLLDAFGCPLEE